MFLHLCFWKHAIISNVSIHSGLDKYGKIAHNNYVYPWLTGLEFVLKNHVIGSQKSCYENHCQNVILRGEISNTLVFLTNTITEYCTFFINKHTA